MECTGEAPENATITIQCNETGVVYDDTTLVEYAKQPMNITGSVPVPLYQQCNISIVFSNGAGSSEPFILAFGKYSVNACSIHHYCIDTTPTMSPTPSPTGTNETTSSPGPGSIINRPGLSLHIKLNITDFFIVFIEIIGVISAICVCIAVLIIIILIVIVRVVKNKKS